MVIKLTRKNKVEASPHFNEIVKRLSEGESSRSVSAWLENTFNEKISHAALNRYKSRNIKMEDRVEAELNKRAEKKKKRKAQKKKKPTKKSKNAEAQIEKEVQKQADKIEQSENDIQTVAETIATNMQGVAKVAAQLPEMFEKTKRQASNPDIPQVTFKDVTSLSIQANKIYADYFKHEEDNIEININEGFGDLADAIKKSREKFKD